LLKEPKGMAAGFCTGIFVFFSQYAYY